MQLSVSVQLMLIVVVGFACQWGAWRIKVPAILPLLLCGIALGPVLHFLYPQMIFGEMLMPSVSIAVAIVLFEGSMTLKFSEIRGLAKPVQRLVTVGALITWVILTLTTWWITDLSIELSLLFGALVTVTGPTVIVPLLRSVRPVASVARILRWEGIVIDPIGALLAVMAYELVLATRTEAALPGAIALFIYTTGFGALAGFITAHAMGQALKRHWLPEYLRAFMVLALVVGLFVLVNDVVKEAGLVAVTVCGITLTNLKGVDTTDILHFKENLTVLLISGLFIVLASQLQLEHLSQLGMTAVIILAVAQLIARPLSVMISTAGSALGWRERALLSWVAPRGIIAASVSALFAQRLAEQHIEGAELLVPLTFMMIIGTVLLQSITARPMARLLKVAEPEPTGVLVISASPVACAIASILQSNGFSVTLIDSNWGNIKAARMQGLNTFYGHPVSSYADHALNLVGIGRMFGLSQYHELNTVAAMRYRMEFGTQNIYTLTETVGTDEKMTTNDRYKGRFLFHDDMTYDLLAGPLARGAVLRQTNLTSEFGFDQYISQPSRIITPLFAIDPSHRLCIFTSENKFRPVAGWSVIGLVEDRKSSEGVAKGMSEPVMMGDIPLAPRIPTAPRAPIESRLPA
ncbi:Sodium/hydrogen exchanger family protein [gamma proteobacterium HdN1]|nr:Sodium/hydrogen exchanger family protein [gamma proteobacterium HdN1]